MISVKNSTVFLPFTTGVSRKTKNSQRINFSCVAQRSTAYILHFDRSQYCSNQIIIKKNLILSNDSTAKNPLQIASSIHSKKISVSSSAGSPSETPYLADAEKDDGDSTAIQSTQEVQSFNPTSNATNKMAEFLTLMYNLLESPYGSPQTLAAAANVVITRVSGDAEKILAEDEGSNSSELQLVFELIRICRLLKLDLELLSSARKEETFLERLGKAKEHCKLAIDVANAL